MSRKSIILQAIAAAVMALPMSAVIAQSKTGLVKIGINEMLSGAFVSVGLPATAGVRLAAKEINDKGGFVVGDTTYKIQLVEVDNKSQTADAVAGMTKLVEDDKVRFVFGPTIGALASQAKEVTVSANAIHFSAATPWQVGGQLSDPKTPLLFGTQNLVSFIAGIDAEGFKQLGAKKVAFMSLDDDTTKANLPSFLAAMKAADIAVVTILAPSNTTDWSIYVTRAKGENVDGIYFLYPQVVAPEVLRAIVDLKVPLKAFGGRAIDPNVAIKTAIGRPLPFPFFTTLNTPSFDFPATPKVKAFQEKMKAFEPRVVGTTANFTFFSYDFVPMLVEAMKRAGTVEDTTKIGLALASLTYDGAAGRICFGKDMRNATVDAGLLVVRDGKLESKAFLTSCK